MALRSADLSDMLTRNAYCFLIDEREVVKHILRHLGLWEEPVCLYPAGAPPDSEETVELFLGDPFPDYSMDAVMDHELCADA